MSMAEDAALRQRVAATLRRALSQEQQQNGDRERDDDSARDDAAPGARARAVATSTAAAATVTSSKSSEPARRLLHWTTREWQAYERAPALTKVVASARVLPVQVPLSSIYEIHFADEQANYTPSAMMEKLLAATRTGPKVNLGLVIDASGSDCFLHDAKEWDDWDVKYVKLRAVIPKDGDEAAHVEAEEELVKQFFEAMSQHKRGPEKDMDVAVFGPRGFNFVGFLIVRYLVETCGLNLDAALKEYATSTPPGIYSRHYLERLYRRYFSTLRSSASSLKIPAPPGWDKDASTDDTGKQIGSDILTEDDHASKFVRAGKTAVSGASPTGASGSSSNGSPHTGHAFMHLPPDRDDGDHRPTKRRKIRSWIDDVVPLEFGETLDASSDEYRSVVQELEKLTGCEGFPGCEAIPLTATHIAQDAFKKRGCLTTAYLVTWRARGRRCLLFVSERGTYVVSRDMTLTRVNMKFPRRRALSECQVSTLLDGIIVQDQDHDHTVARYLAFDVLFVEGSPVWQKKLEKRLQCLQNEIILPRKNDQSFDYAKEPFRVRMKDHFRLAKTEYLLQRFVKEVTHSVEGVLFTPTEAPYNLGGFESEDPILKFVASADSGIPGLDGSISEDRLLRYIRAMPQK